MRKNLKVSIIFFVFVLVFTICIIKIFPFGNKKYINLNNSFSIELPKFSFDIETTENSITFKNFRSKNILKTELNRMLSNTQKYLCKNKFYYYDENNNLTFMDYKFSNESIFNKIEIEYYKGIFSNNECGIVGDYKELKYSITPVNDTGYCYIANSFDYTDEEGNLQKVYYDCFGNLALKNGMGKYIYIDQIFSYKWISMSELISFLEYQVKNGNFSKQQFDDYGSIIYENRDFFLLSCSTKNGNKSVYIGKKIITDKQYCR